MEGFLSLLAYGTKRRLKDFFIIFYNVVYPIGLTFILGYIATNYFKGDSSVTSNGYYTLVMIPYFIFSSIITMAYVAKDESFYKTSYRFIAAPIGHEAIVFSKIISCTFVVWLCSIFDLLVSKLILNIYIGDSGLIIITLFLMTAFMSSAIGIYLGIAFKNFDTLQGILNIPLSIFAILGGTFFPTGSLGKLVEKVSYVSPLTWINRGIIASVYDNSTSTIIFSIIIVGLIGAVFTFIAVKAFKKEAFL
ncbi:ABC transporter permease [Clostridium oryzae]|uniref:Transport permease protein n=1 Tax=Clostridium oryzae TaxID=1450648 RepID=A0A1V4IW65_9CLOT|nr:ABC transporter permease [Clostridium oryzae]OPJ64139.1 ABC-2 type transporter [Clostridium oryzae]